MAMADSSDAQFPAPVNPDDPGRGPLIMGLTWTFSSLCLFVVGSRFVVRIKVIKHLTADDWLMLVAAMLNLLCQAFATKSYAWGLGKHDRDLTFEQLVNVVKWVWIQATFGISSSIVARISITIFLIRIFSIKVWLKRFLIITTTIQTVVAILLIFVNWLHIRPIEGLWNPTLATHRLDPLVHMSIAYLTASLFAFADLAYVLLPVMVVWNLKLEFRRKLGLCILLGLSVVTMGVAITRGVYGQGITGQPLDDAQYRSCMGLLWSLLEQSFVILMGCAPSLRPITQLNFTLHWKIPSSLRTLMGSSGANHDTEDSTELMQNSHGRHHSMGTSGQTPHQFHPGDISHHFDKTYSHDVGVGGIRRTDQYMVTFSPEEDHLRSYRAADDYV